MRTSRLRSVDRRSLSYAGLAITLLAVSIPLSHAPWTFSPWVHTILESLGTTLALTVGAVALVRYSAGRIRIFCPLGGAFLAAGVLNAIHTVLSAPSFAEYLAKLPAALVPWSAVISRLYLSGMMCVVLLSSRALTADPTVKRVQDRRWCLVVTLGAFASLAVVLLIPFPPALYGGYPIRRAIELASGVLFTIAALACWLQGQWKSRGFYHWLLLFLITAASGQLVYMPLSTRDLDPEEWMAHVLAILACGFVLASLSSSF